MIVADTNLIAHVFIESGSSPVARQVMVREPSWVSPFLWRSELRNTLVKFLRAGILSQDIALRIVAAAEIMMAGRESDVRSGDVIAIAASSGCSAYDAEFVVLAKDLGVPLVTTDKELLEKFPGIAVTPEQFLARP